ncbi:Protein of unknown function [Bacillus mycoides]|nr:Protein of unknown function [Bacillus mycoides]
MQGEVVGE